MKNIINKLIALTIIFTPFIIGLLVLMAFFGNLYSNIAFDKATLVDGTVTDITNERKGTSNTRYFAPIVEFQYEGETYEFQDLGASVSKYQEGDSVQVVVNEESKRDSRIYNFSNIWLPLLIQFLIAVVLLVPSSLLIYVYGRGLYIKQYLKKNGKRINAKIIRFETKESSKGKVRYYIIAEGKIPSETKETEFKSQKFRKNPEEKFKVGQFVTVLVDPKNSERYFFDLDVA